jgi:hypothetical protein
MELCHRDKPALSIGKAPFAQAQMQYAADNSGSYTLLWASDRSLVWQQRLAPYLGINHMSWDTPFWNDLRMDPKSIFNVPDSKSKSQRTAGATSIGLNISVMADEWKYRTIAVPRPSQTILLGETPVEFNGEGIRAPDTGAGYTTFNRSGRTRMLMVFCDGHVEALDLASLSDNATNRSPGQPNLWRWW